MSGIHPNRHGSPPPGLHTRPSYLSTRESVAALGTPDGAIGEEATELLEEFVGTHQHHPRHEGADGAGMEAYHENDSAKRVDEWKRLPWWKRPSPWWLIAAVPFSSVAKSAALAPQVELFIQLACRVHKPDIFNSGHSVNDTDNPVLNMALPPVAVVGSPDEPFVAPGVYSEVSPQYAASTHEKRAAASMISQKPKSPCAADPTVQAAVARLSAVTLSKNDSQIFPTSFPWLVSASSEGYGTDLMTDIRC